MTKIKLFDKKFVYFMWDDELNDKEGFCADDICELTNCVRGGDFHHTKVRKSLSPAFPFKDADNSDWLFFYYDPNYDAKRAYNEGKQIQIKCDDMWLNISEPTWQETDEYRIKPELQRMTYRQLAEWLAKGNGQCKTGDVAVTQLGYDNIDEKDDRELPVEYEIRRWGSDEWIEPTVDVYIEAFK